ncbi:NlpC/P60 family protein [Klebsiella aerogenes]|uniref:NlpC/P60 family protein n=1 Tax=Klebsiella aerogenes TaxID=548 RepID=UPI001F187577|nr:NlpC/P60 family protein [Klebsiella aerogenes]
MYLKKILTLLLFCLVTSAGHVYASSASPGLIALKHRNSLVKSSRSKITDAKSKILKQYSGWKGTRYHFGGRSHRGIDCSGLIQVIFRGAVGMRLPRTTNEQMRKGFNVTRNKLKPGDLVFFKTSPETRHVGVYVGNRKFIHASKIKGVTISSLDSRYWRSHYETSRRILTTA